MGTLEPCPVCGSTDALKFDAESNWCYRCADSELDAQAAEDTWRMNHEVIGG